MHICIYMSACACMHACNIYVYITYMHACMHGNETPYVYIYIMYSTCNLIPIVEAIKKLMFQRLVLRN